MNIILQTFNGQDDSSLARAQAGCIAVAVFEKRKLSAEAKALDAAGGITAALKSGDISGKPGSGLLLRNVPGTAAERVLLIGMGDGETLTAKAFRDGVGAALRLFATLGAEDALLAFPFDGVDQRDTAWAVRHVAQAAHESAYRSDMLKSEKKETTGVARITLAVKPGSPADAALAEGNATGEGQALARELGDLPPNICTPMYLADRARQLATQYGFGLEVLDREALRTLKMESYLAVASGSYQAPAMVVLRHMGGSNQDKPLMLVGKGLTFDSGGISIKPSAAMDEMKYDMCGAAAVLGVFRAIGELRLPLNVIGIVAACENMPSGGATRPGDIVTAMNGLSIEILNTDAEGRLVLCDALTYAERFEPAAVIDIATLTGACTLALGSYNSGLFTRDDEVHVALATELLQAGQESGDRAWRMPLEDEYKEQLKSNFADLANIGTPGGGAVVAAAFLERFTRAYTWAHLDIAGTAWKSGGDKGATGRPVPLLTRFLCKRAAPYLD